MRKTISITLVVLAALAALAPTAGAAAKKPRTTYYLSLGDSLAAGYYKDPGNVVRYSAVDYTHLLYAKARKKDRHLKLATMGCPGESTATFQQNLGCPGPRSA